MDDPNGKVVLVTGAGTGMGRAALRQFAAAGARVFLIARSETDLGRLCEELQGQGARAAWAAVDVDKPADLVLAERILAERAGGTRSDDHEVETLRAPS